MARALAVALAAAVAFAIGGAQPTRPATKETYVAGVRVSGNHVLVKALFEDVVYFGYFPCRLGCQHDERTAVGVDWLRSERRLAAELDRFADRLEALRPPRQVADLHRLWVSVVRGCRRELEGLEDELQLIDNLDVIYEFQKKVARAARDWCFDPFHETERAFDEKSFAFPSAVSWPFAGDQSGFFR